MEETRDISQTVLEAEFIRLSGKIEKQKLLAFFMSNLFSASSSLSEVPAKSKKFLRRCLVNVSSQWILI